MATWPEGHFIKGLNSFIIDGRISSEVKLRSQIRDHFAEMGKEYAGKSRAML